MRRLAAIGILVFVVVVLGVAQLVLPGIAAQRVRDQLSGHGQVLSVQVSAFPAIELLWHHADSVTVRLASYRSSSGALGGRLGQVSDTGSLHVSAALVNAGLLTVHDAVLIKSGDQLTASAAVSETDLRQAVPILQAVTPVASAGGNVTLRGTADVFGAPITADATLGPQDGDLVLTGLGGLATLRVFHAPAIAVESVAATPTSGGFELSGTALVR
jgi:hypothetical protein